MVNKFSRYHIDDSGKLVLVFIEDESGITNTGYKFLFKSEADIIKTADIFREWEDHYQSSLKPLLAGNKAEGVSHRERLSEKTSQKEDAIV